jgi:hypothetical protein
MDPCLYNRKECADLMIETENELEKKWKTRILFENTPRGNIIMYYNPFKNSFVYYCDNSSLPYHMLNAVVMKYVVLYRCVDLFLDENVSGETPSPLSHLIKEYEKDKEKKPDTEKIALPKSSAFAKFKKYGTPTPKALSETNAKPEEKMINSIVRGGKIHNFSFIQKIETKSKGFRSALLDEHPKINSWRDFKQKTQLKEND